ncbi:hypothetical protein DPMN_122256 [Dreissena polymorpha]|uniref:Uncharacterized protein n=1 Tax=Dreissena polymorpha TaxID=45954 RepID=A0A9D4GPB7_DREPO|nr:hypothetical protein DPMN_122256 [Dreissena polymorpha]
MTTRQLQMGLERYEFNKLQNYKSIVPITDQKLFDLLKSTLMSSLRNIQFTMDFVTDMGLDIKWHGRVEGEAAHYCNVCEVEVFNIPFVEEQESKFVVHCQGCSVKMQPKLEGFVDLNQHRLEDLIAIYNSFTIQLPARQINTY